MHNYCAIGYPLLQQDNLKKDKHSFNEGLKPVIICLVSKGIIPILEYLNEQPQ